MCAIAGQIDWSRPADESVVERMLRTQAHRGPDGSARWAKAGACVGANRLALVDRAGGGQPMVSPDGRYVLVYNGEIYNHAELRTELAGLWPFTTRSDTELLLAALLHWGEAALVRLNGMFSFFLWDSREARGWGARDRLGVKPFVYQWRQSEEGGQLRFASEAKALVAVDGARPRAHAESILEYLVAPMFSGVEHSMFEGIEHLGAGQLLRVEQGRIETRRWWSIAVPAEADQNDPPSIDELRAGVITAVTRTLIADVPLGVYLSGGLDSSLIAAIAVGVQRQCIDRAFTVAFSGQAEIDYRRSRIVLSDDEPFAALAANALDLRRQVCPANGDLSASLRTLAVVNDALPAWEQELALHHLAHAAGAHVKAVLVGDAADETHWGYHFLLDDEATQSPAAIVRRFGSAPIAKERLADPVAHFAARYQEAAERDGHRWQTVDERRRATTHLIVTRWLGRLLHNGDIHAMSASVEARVPFADIDLLALAARVPPSLGLRSGQEKWALRAAARDLVPEAIRQRRKSALPKDQRPEVELIFRSQARRALAVAHPLLASYLDVPAVERLVDAPGRLDEAERAVLFRVIALGHWAEHYGVTS